MGDAHTVLAAVPRRLADCTRQRRLKRGQALFRIDDRPQHIFFVLSGELRLIRTASSGAEIVLHRSRCGFFAEASLDAETYHCDGIATSDSDVLDFPLRGFRAALEDDSGFSHAFRQHLAREVIKLRARSERLSLKTAAERVVHFVETEGRDGIVALPYSKKAWAADLGLTHEALYRALGKMEQAGMISIEGSNSVEVSIVADPRKSFDTDNA